jgi:hypothetical protein
MINYRKRYSPLTRLTRTDERDDGHAQTAGTRRDAKCSSKAANAALGTAMQQRWLARLDAEHDNLRAAMRWAQTSGQAETMARLAGGLWRFWYGRGYLTEGRRWLLEALAAADEIPAADRLQLLLGVAALAHAQGEGVGAVAAESAIRMRPQIVILRSDTPTDRSGRAGPVSPPPSCRACRDIASVLAPREDISIPSK